MIGYLMVTTKSFDSVGHYYEGIDVGKTRRLRDCGLDLGMLLLEIPLYNHFVDIP